jgi:hypothetical protein
MTTAFPATTPTGPAQEAARLVREAFRRRAAHAIAHIAETATLATLAEALAAPTDFGAVARALGDPAGFAEAAALDPLADALARGAAEREGLARAAGGLLPAAEIGRRLGISRQAVDKRRRNRQLLAMRVADEWRYPAAQIGTDGSTVPGLAEILTILGDLGPWVVLDFLLARDTALEGATPLAALQAGGPAAAAVRRIAQSRADGIA